MKINRRDFLKLAGAAAALLGLGGMPDVAQAKEDEAEIVVPEATTQDAYGPQFDGGITASYLEGFSGRNTLVIVDGRAIEGSVSWHLSVGAQDYWMGALSVVDEADISYLYKMQRDYKSKSIEIHAGEIVFTGEIVFHPREVWPSSGSFLNSFEFTGLGPLNSRNKQILVTHADGSITWHDTIQDGIAACDKAPMGNIVFVIPKLGESQEN